MHNWLQIMCNNIGYTIINVINIIDYIQEYLGAFKMLI